MYQNWKVRILATAILPLLPAMAQAEHAEPPLAPILLDLEARSSHRVGECYAEEDTRHSSGLPGLTQRLEQVFPSGSNESNLITTLTKQGFGTVFRCKSDPSIRNMHFEQHRVKDGGISEWLFSLTYIAEATVYWKVSPANTIMWLKGTLAYDGL